LNRSESLCQAIAQRIGQSEPQRITFADFMEMALYHPTLGYYCAPHSVIGPEGDFITSPHMGHDFGEVLAEQFADMWQALGEPNPFTLVEMGAGQGLVAADVLEKLRSHHPTCFACLQYIVIEASAALKAEQQKRLSHWQAEGVQLSWQTLETLPAQSVVGCVFSNELVDAFPVHWVERHNQTWQEMWVSTGEQGFTPVLAELSTPRLQSYLNQTENQTGIDFASHPDGYRSEINLAALDWIKAVSERLARGYVLTIDYGYTAARYYSAARSQGTLQCYYRHAHHDDPFVYVGEQDITAHVDFTALEKYGEKVGLQKLGFTQQGLFLMALGLSDRLAALSYPQKGDQAVTGATIQAMMRRRDALQQLISPMGLGNFGVLIQSKGLTTAEIVRTLKGLTIPPMM
jgi:SAM-dependent MidA family methyltransferase